MSEGQRISATLKLKKRKCLQVSLGVEFIMNFDNPDG